MLISQPFAVLPRATPANKMILFLFLDWSPSGAAQSWQVMLYSALAGLALVAVLMSGELPYLEGTPVSFLSQTLMTTSK